MIVLLLLLPLVTLCPPLSYSVGADSGWEGPDTIPHSCPIPCGPYEELPHQPQRTGGRDLASWSGPVSPAGPVCPPGLPQAALGGCHLGEEKEGKDPKQQLSKLLPSPF